MNFGFQNKNLYQVTFRGNRDNILKLKKAINSTPLNIDKFKKRNGRELGLNRSRFWLPIFLLEFVLDTDPINRKKRESATLLFQECLNNLEMSSIKIELMNVVDTEIKIQYAATDYFRDYLKRIAEEFNLEATVRKIEKLGFSV